MRTVNAVRRAKAAAERIQLKNMNYPIFNVFWKVYNYSKHITRAQNQDPYVQSTSFQTLEEATAFAEKLINNPNVHSVEVTRNITLVKAF